jgi:hypothetical protein
MIELKNIYRKMERVSAKYDSLKSIFCDFNKNATMILTRPDCPVKGITISPELDKNYFDVIFVGNQVRFSFLIAEKENKELEGFVTCTCVSSDTKLVDRVIHEFSFDTDGAVNLKMVGDDPIYIDNEYIAGQLVLYFLAEAISKK